MFTFDSLKVGDKVMWFPDYDEDYGEEPHMYWGSEATILEIKNAYEIEIQISEGIEYTAQFKELKEL